MNRGQPLRRTPFKRATIARKAPSPPAKATRQASYAGATTGPVAKQPADRNLRLRELARGEVCTLLLPGCCCHPETTVWGHTNTQADAKGMGYKGHDSKGFFAGDACHREVDQGTRYSANEKAAFIEAAQERTTARLREISAAPSLRPWKIQAARWALERR